MLRGEKLEILLANFVVGGPFIQREKAKKCTTE